MRRSISILLLLAVGLVAGSLGGRPAEPKKEARPARDDCPRGDCCLWRLGLEAKGRLEHKLGTPHDCPTGPTAFGTGFLELDLRGRGQPCDEKHGLIPDGSKLNAAIHTHRRKDDVAYICGTFTISYQDRPIFTGDIDLMHRVNTHHGEPFGKDPCDRKDHLQGWLTGKGVEDGRARGHLLRAMLVARTDPRNGGEAGYAVGRANIDGLILKCEPGK